SVNVPLNDGIAPAPFVTRSTTSESGGFAWSRFGPTVPVVPASASVWHPPHGPVLKIVFPATGSPFLYWGGTVTAAVGATVPRIVEGVAVVTVPPGAEQAIPTSMSGKNSGNAIRTVRRTSASLYPRCDA